MLTVPNEVGCCVLAANEGEADVVLDGWFANESDSSALAFSVITGLSVYTIPSWVNTKIHINAVVKNGKKSQQYDLRDSMLFAQWLPFIVVAPFRENALKTEEYMNKNLYRNLLLKIKNDGLINLKTKKV